MMRKSVIKTAALAACVALPPIYLFVMIQYGAIRLPFWDHLLTAAPISRFFDGALTFRDLLEPINQARPLFPRLIFVANAALTDWDIRSEFVYIYATIYGALLALLIFFWRTTRSSSLDIRLTGALIISIIACSPVGSNNHYWSLMLIATLNYVCTIVAFALVALSPKSVLANVAAAVLAWISTYSMTQGLFLFPLIFLLHQIISEKPIALNKWGVFWLANLVVCCFLYFPGLALHSELMPRPEVLNFLAFIPVYIGNPLGSLVWFYDVGAFGLSSANFSNGAWGAIILIAICVTAVRVLREMPTQRPEALIFFLFSLYAAVCAVATAAGRANGPEPISSANSSRYSIFAAFFLFALVFYYGPKLARGDIVYRFWHKVAIGLFVIAATAGYIEGIKTYASAHDANAWMADAYSPHAEFTDTDNRMFNVVETFRARRSDLQRLGIGPYKDTPHISSPIYSGAFLSGVPLTPGVILTQRFRTERPFLRTITFQVVTWGAIPTPYQLHWSAIGLRDGVRTPLGEGSFTTSGLTDWKTVSLKTSAGSASAEVEVSFSADGENIQRPIGLGLFPPGPDQISPATMNGVGQKGKSVLGLTVEYLR